MKRAGNLIERIIDPDNLRLAWIKTIRGKRTRRSVLRFRDTIDIRLGEMAGDIENGRYRWGSFSRFTIYDPKEREIKVASLRDRVAYHAIVNICEPVFDRYQIDQSCACRKGKGQSEAIRLAVSYSKKYRWYLKLDARKYFDSISHAVLKQLLRRLFKDQRLLALLDDLIDSYQTQDNRGIPIGSLTSQFFANHYLGVLDHFVKEKLKCRAYVRYMDDFVLWEDRKEKLLEHHKEIENFVTKNLSLTLKAPCLNKTERGLPFLGYRIYPGRVRLSRRSRVRFKKKYRKAMTLFERGIWDESDLALRLESLFAFVRKAESREFRLRVMREGFRP